MAVLHTPGPREKASRASSLEPPCAGRYLSLVDVARPHRARGRYYFHNCIDDQVYTRARLSKADGVPTGDVLRRLDERWDVVLVGDAAMHPAEPLEPNGAIDFRTPRPRPASSGSSASRSTSTATSG